MSTDLSPAGFLELLAAGAGGCEASCLIAADALEERKLISFIPDYEPTIDDPTRPGDPNRDIVVLSRMVDLMQANPRQAAGRAGWARGLLAAILFLHYPRHPWPMVERCKRAFDDFFVSYPDEIMLAVLEYEVRCEEFDRTLPGVWIPGARPPEWMPHLMGPSRAFSRARRDEMNERLRGYDLGTIRACRNDVQRLSHEDRVAELEHLRRRV